MGRGDQKKKGKNVIFSLFSCFCDVFDMFRDVLDGKKGFCGSGRMDPYKGDERASCFVHFVCGRIILKRLADVSRKNIVKQVLNFIVVFNPSRYL